MKTAKEGFEKFIGRCSTTELRQLRSVYIREIESQRALIRKIDALLQTREDNPRKESRDAKSRRSRAV